MSEFDDKDPPERVIVEHKARRPGFWLGNLTGMEAFRYRAWRAGISAEIDRACEAFIRSESSEWQLVEEMLAKSAAPKPTEAPAVVELVTVPAVKESA